MLIVRIRPVRTLVRDRAGTTVCVLVVLLYSPRHAVQSALLAFGAEPPF